ncbi:MAG: hypothetical protein IPK52_17625 [Chloroflexi bacterium]|nr:hypothetical protein [Chloroflexota bacterium]
MFRTVRNIVIGFVAFVSLATLVRFIVMSRMTPEQREKLGLHFKEAVEAGKHAAAERREKLEGRLHELVGENNLN